MWGWIGNGTLAASPTRWMRRWKPIGLIGPPRSENFFCTVVKGRTAVWSTSRSQCRMEAPGRVRGMRRRHEPRGQPHFCLATERLCGPPVGGTVWFQIFIQAPSLEIWRKTIFGGEGGCWRGKRGGLFWATSLEKIFGGVLALISFHLTWNRGGSLLPLGGVLSSVGSTGGTGCETARVHHADRRRGGVAARSTRTT